MTDAEPTPDRPEVRPIRSAADAEEAAAVWMRHWGIADARATPPGADGGIDVVSSTAVAQVKAHVKPVGRPDLQRLQGIAASSERRALFFALAGYTPQALTWGNTVEMALFRFDLAGDPQPVNAAASELSRTPLDPGQVRAASVPVGPTGDQLAGGTATDPDSAEVREWRSTGGDQIGQFIRYARRLKGNNHRVTGYCTSFAASDSDRAVVERWAELGVRGTFVVVDHETGRVEGYDRWPDAYAATLRWDGRDLAPSVLRSIGRQPTPDGSGDDTWNGRDFYVILGRTDIGAERWGVGRRYGFVGAGDGDAYSRPLQAFAPGHRVFAYVGGAGYVGVGLVTGSMVPLRNLVVGEGPSAVRVVDQPDIPAWLTQRAKLVDAEHTEYAVPVRWLASRDITDAVWEPGLFSARLTACKLRDQRTIDVVSAAFGVHEGIRQPGNPDSLHDVDSNVI